MSSQRSQKGGTSQLSQSQHKINLSQSQSQLSEVDRDEIAKKVLIYLLRIQCSNKPVKRTKIMKDLAINARVVNEVIQVVKTQLENVFDIELKQTLDNPPQYYLINKQQPRLDIGLMTPNVLNKETKVLLLLILTLIKKKGGLIKHDELMSFFKKCEIIKSINEPVGIGVFQGIDFAKLLQTELTEMLYIKVNIVRTNVSDVAYFEYLWGRRAESEVNNDELDKFYSGIQYCNLFKNNTE